MNELEKLKDILFGDERQALDDLSRRLETPEVRSADIADVLPDALHRSFKNDPRLMQALQAPFEQTLRTAIRRSPKTFADALFPIIGPAIRKSIAESMRAMVQSINYALENGLSPKRQIMWRFEAARAGIPLGEYVLQKTLRYRVEHAYLIHRESGLLAAHVQHAEATAADSDAVSAMFTAIQDFMKDSFHLDQSSGLETAELGRYTLWSVLGPHAVVACVIRGVPPRSLRNEIAAVVERIHLRFGEALFGFDGDGANLAGVDFELEECLRFEHHEQEREEAAAGAGVRKSLPAIIVGALLLALLGWYAFHRYTVARETDNVREVMRLTPGILATEVLYSDGKIHVRGLRDPRAPSPATLAGAAGIDPSRLASDLRPYQSLEPAMVVARAYAALDPPGNVRFSLVDGTLIARGTAPAGWAAEAAVLGPVIGGVEAVDFSGLRPGDEDLLAAARAALSPPETVGLTVRDAILTVTGLAPRGWIDSLLHNASGIDGLQDVDGAALMPLEDQAFRELAAGLHDASVGFSDGTELDASAGPQLERIAVALRELDRLARVLGYQVEAVLVGMTDPTGPKDLNDALQIDRATLVRARLEQAGVPGGLISIAGAGHLPVRNADEPDLTNRRVTVALRIMDMDGHEVALQ